MGRVGDESETVAPVGEKQTSRRGSGGNRSWMQMELEPARRRLG